MWRRRRIEGLSAVVDVSGSESVRVGSTGSTIELSGDGKIEYTSFVWRSSSSFDEYENAIPLISDVEEVIIRSIAQGGTRAIGGVSETNIHVDMRGSGGGDDWRRVWGSTIGMGTFSLDGLHIHFERQDVIGMRLGSWPPSNPSWRWSEAAYR